MLAMAANFTIASVEELVEPDEVLPGLFEIYISPLHVDAVVVAPGGAHPTTCPGKYETDLKHLEEYVMASKSDDTFQEYLEKYVLGPKDLEEYQKIVGFDPNGN